MKKLLLALFLTLSSSALAANAETIEEHHSAAMKALAKCKSAWFQSSREQALKTIESSGLSIATLVDPLARSAQRDLMMLEEVTGALRQCTEIAFEKQ